MPDPDPPPSLPEDDLAASTRTEEPPPVRVSLSWPLAARFAISIAILAVIFRKFDVSWSDLIPDWSAATVSWLVTAAALVAGAVVLSALRWKQVLLAMELRVSLRRLTSHYFVCQLVSNALPTTIGGDVLRVARLANDTGDTADSFASVVIERLTGWLVLPLITVAGLAVSAAARDADHASAVAIAVAACTLLGLAAILYVADHPRLGGRFIEREGWKRHLGAVHIGVGQLKRHPSASLGVLGAGVSYQLVLVASAFAAAQALGIPAATFGVMMAFYPAVLMLQVLPISISGFGVREGALVLFLTPLGTDAPRAVALGVLLGALTLATSLLGLPAFFTGARPEQPA